MHIETTYELTRGVCSLASLIMKDSFRLVRKIAKMDYKLRHVCTSVCMEQLCCYGTEFQEI